MAKAWKAPSSTYRRSFVVTDHALQRLRERALDAGRADHRPNWDLGNCLDEAITDAMHSARVVKDDKTGRTLWLVEISGYFDFPAVAVVREGLGAPGERIVVTVLTEEMVRESLKNGKFTQPDEPKATLADAVGPKLEALKARLPETAPAPTFRDTAPPKPAHHKWAAVDNATLVAEYKAGATTRELGEKYGIAQTSVCGRLSRSGVVLGGRSATARAQRTPKPAPAPAASPDPTARRLVTFVRGGQSAHQITTAGEVTATIEGLLGQGVAAASLEVWVPRKVRVSIAVEE